MISLHEIAKNINEAEVDDDEIIKYKDKDGESAEMKAGSAKTMEKDHPAKLAWDKMQDDGGDDKKDSGGKLGGSDFSRDGGDDEPKGEPESDDEPKDSELASKLSKMDDDEFEKEMDDIRDQAKNLAFQKMYSDPTSTAYMGGAPSEKEEEEFRKKYDAYQAEYEKRNPQDEPEDEPKDEPKKKGFFSKMFGKKESISINGKKYKAIKESKEPTKPTIHPFKETYKKIGGK